MEDDATFILYRMKPDGHVQRGTTEAAAVKASLPWHESGTQRAGTVGFGSIGTTLGWFRNLFSGAKEPTDSRNDKKEKHGRKAIKIIKKNQN